jgi:hypothetical protein
MTISRDAFFSVITLALGVAGCGGAAGDIPGGERFTPVDEPGRGSGTLAVEARIEASPAIGERAARADDTTTNFEVDVRDASGVRVGGAVVVVESALGAVTLTEGGCGRDYCGRQIGYARTYLLSAERGTDSLEGVRVVGPRFHTLTDPIADTSVDGALPLTVAWIPSGDADETTIETREYRQTEAGDSGRHDVPAGTLRTRDDRPEDERARVTRVARLALSGVVGSGTAVVEIRNGVAFTTDPAAP